MRINFAVLIIGALIALGAYAIYDRVEFYKKSEEGPWSEAAQRNPFFAAQRYLEAEHVVVRSDAELMPREDLVKSGTLILSRSTAILNQEVADKVLRWIQQGGHLIVAPGYQSNNDLLLSRFYIKRIWPKEKTPSAPKPAEPAKATNTKPAEPIKSKDEEPTEKKLSEIMREYNASIRQGEKKTEKNSKEVNTQCQAPDPTNLTEVSLPDNTLRMQIDFANYSVLEQPYLTTNDHAPARDVPKPDFFIGNKSGVHLVQFKVGAGKLTVLSDMEIWMHKDIGEHDHVLLLDALIDHKQPVHILYGVNSPKLTALMWRYGPESIVAATLLLIAWLFHRGRRFGPILDAIHGERRASSEHWLAAARYQWQRGQIAALLKPLRQTVERKAALRFPGFSQWPLPEQLAALNVLSAIPAADLHLALHAPAPRHADQFRDCVATLQLLGNYL